jgi:hypothetical protein
LCFVANTIQTDCNLIQVEPKLLRVVGTTLNYPPILYRHQRQNTEIPLDLYNQPKFIRGIIDGYRESPRWNTANSRFLVRATISSPLRFYILYADDLEFNDNTGFRSQVKHSDQTIPAYQSQLKTAAQNQGFDMENAEYFLIDMVSVDQSALRSALDQVKHSTTTNAEGTVVFSGTTEERHLNVPVFQGSCR